MPNLTTIESKPSKRLLVSLFLVLLSLGALSQAVAGAHNTACIGDLSSADICEVPSRVQTWGGSRAALYSSYEKENIALGFSSLSSMNEFWRLGFWGSTINQNDESQGDFGMLIGAQTTPYRSYSVGLQNASESQGRDGFVSLSMSQLWSKGLFDVFYQAGINLNTNVQDKNLHVFGLGSQFQISPDSSDLGIMLHGLAKIPALEPKAFYAKSLIQFKNAQKESWVLNMGFQLEPESEQEDLSMITYLSFPIVRNDSAKTLWKMDLGIDHFTLSTIQDARFTLGVQWLKSPFATPRVGKPKLSINKTILTQQNEKNRFKDSLTIYPSYTGVGKVTEWSLNLYQVDSLGFELRRVDQWKSKGEELPKELIWRGFSKFGNPLPPSFYRLELWIQDPSGRIHPAEKRLIEIKKNIPIMASDKALKSLKSASPAAF